MPLKIFLVIIINLSIVVSMHGQATSLGDSCPKIEDPSLFVYILGERDSAEYKEANKVIARTLIKDSMEVLLSDTSYKLITYSFLFYAQQSEEVVKLGNKGSVLALSKEAKNHLARLLPDTFLGIVNIQVQKLGRCFTIPNKLYYLTN